jgi:hypothetical protein
MRSAVESFDSYKRLEEIEAKAVKVHPERFLSNSSGPLCKILIKSAKGFPQTRASRWKGGSERSIRDWRYRSLDNSSVANYKTYLHYGRFPTPRVETAIPLSPAANQKRPGFFQPSKDNPGSQPPSIETFHPNCQNPRFQNRHYPCPCHLQLHSSSGRTSFSSVSAKALTRSRANSPFLLTCLIILVSHSPDLSSRFLCLA